MREKEVNEADSEPRVAAVKGPPSDVEEAERLARSRLMEVDCLSAELNCVF